MLDLATRTAILKLHAEGHGARIIARAVGASRASVRRVIASGRAEVPALERSDRCSPHIERILELHRACRGNLVRVQEELGAAGIQIPYTTLTRFCRAQQIGVSPPQRAGRYTFLPGEEMQHDTSPHVVAVGGRSVRLQCASVVLCFSRRRFIQCYHRFTRFHVRVFLTQALRAFGGAPERCMVDNSTVIMARGTGADAVPAPEMEAFARHFGFAFVAHAVGDANRSARVEGPFHHVETNFYPGRTFRDLADLNAQLLVWCDAYNAAFHRSFQGTPDALFCIERPTLRPLSAHVPEPTDIHVRRVDTEGLINLHTNRYSVSEARIGQQLDVHETPDKVRIFAGHRLIVEHDKRDEGLHLRVILPEHRHRGRQRKPQPPSPEESAMRAANPALAALCDALRVRHGGGALKAIRRLYRVYTDYPDALVFAAASRALEHRLIEPDRIETMVLASVRGDFFRLPNPEDPHGR